MQIIKDEAVRYAYLRITKTISKLYIEKFITHIIPYANGKIEVKYNIGFDVFVCEVIDLEIKPSGAYKHELYRNEIKTKVEYSLNDVRWHILAGKYCK